MCSRAEVARAAFSPPDVVEVAVAAVVEADVLGRAAMAQWVTDGRIRGVTAMFKRTGPEVAAEEEEEEGEEGDEVLVRPATRTRGFLIRAISNGTRGPARLLKESITTRIAWALLRRVSHGSWRAFWLSKAIKWIG